METQVKADDKFEITGAQAVDILNAINLLPPSKVGKLFVELQDSIVAQASSKQVKPEPEAPAEEAEKD